MCSELQTRNEELNATIGNLQEQLANHKETVITLESYRAEQATEKALHALITLHPEDRNVFWVVQKYRELKKQYLSGEK